MREPHYADDAVTQLAKAKRQLAAVQAVRDDLRRQSVINESEAQVVDYVLTQLDAALSHEEQP